MNAMRRSLMTMLLLASAAAACKSAPDRAELRDEIGDRADQVSGTVESAVGEQVQAVQTAGVDNAVASAVAAASAGMDRAALVAGWIVTTARSIASVIEAQEALADDPALLQDPLWQTKMTNGAGGLRTAGIDAQALADGLAAEDRLHAVQKSLAEVGDELSAAGDRLDEAMATGDAAEVIGATPTLSATLEKVNGLEVLLKSAAP